MKPLLLALAWTYAGFMARPTPPAPAPRPAAPAPPPRPPDPPPAPAPPPTTWRNAAGLWEGRGAKSGTLYQWADRAYLESQLPDL